MLMLERLIEIILFSDHTRSLCFLFRLGKKDYKAWAKGLKKAGYATDPKYPDKLIRLIERFDLDAYDKKRKVVLTAQTKAPKKVRKHRFIPFKRATPLYSIAKKLNLELEALKRANGIKDNTIYLGQELVLPKK